MIDIEKLAKLITENCDWDAFAGLCMDLINDPGFKSRSDNMIVSSIREKSFSHFCDIPLIYVDKNGRDYELFGDGCEYKSQQKIFRDRKPNDKYGELLEKGIFQKDDTFPIKMRNLMGSKKTDIESFLKQSKETKTCDFYIIHQASFPKFRIGLVEESEARKRFYAKGDGVYSDIPKDCIYFLDLPPIVPISINDYKFDEDFYTKIKLNDLFSTSLEALAQAKFDIYRKISSYKKKN